MVLKVEVSEGRKEQKLLQLNPDNPYVAPFPIRSFMFAEHYHLKCLQRVYNSVAN